MLSLSQQIPKSKLMGVVHALWMSKLRYGLQLCSKVQSNTEERKSALMKMLQLTQNRLLRSFDGTQVSDKVSIASMLAKFKLPSVNRLAAEIKLLEVWKSINVQQCPLKLEPYNPHQGTSAHELRPKTNRIYNDSAKLAASQSSFHVDAAKLWNNCTQEIREAKTLHQAKRLVKDFCDKLPI